LRSWLVQNLSLDLRSLALFRICLALVLLQDIVIRACDLTAHYTDSGVLPRQTGTFWSLHMISGSWEWQLLLFSFQAFWAVLLLLGWRTRLTTVVSWFLMLSLHHRNTHILDGGDFYFRSLLMWAMFLPLGDYWSIDWASESPHSSESEKSAVELSWFGAGAIAYPMQVTLLYLVSGYLKQGVVWTTDHTALYRTLSLGELATPRAAWLLQSPQWMKKLTVFTLWLERCAPLLFWCPGFVRLFTVFLFIGLHISFGLFIHLGVFCSIGIVG
ncbi:unnamed protein product, partial [Phaeothamnion confervicola]